MNEPPEATSQPPVQLARAAYAIRFALVAIVLCFSYFTLRSSLSIGRFEALFNDIYGDHRLPTITRFVITCRPAFVVISVLVPIAAIFTLFTRSIVGPFYIVGALALITVAEFIILYHGLLAPLLSTTSRMSGALGL